MKTNKTAKVQEKAPVNVRPNIENVVVCGVGAAGSNILLHLIYAFPNLNYTVIDFDKVESRNWEAGTQPYSKIDLHRPKTQAIQRVCMTLREKKVNSVNMRINSTKELENLFPNPSTTLFIDAFDNAASRNLFIPLKKYSVIHVGFSASLNGEAVWNEIFTHMTASPKDAEIDVCEMTLARPFIFALTAMATISITTFLETGRTENLYFDKYLIARKY